MNGEVVMSTKVMVAIVASFLLATTFGTGGSDSPQDISGAFNLVEVNDSKLPAVTWERQRGERECKRETLSGTMLLDSQGRWAVLVEERELCADNSEEEPTVTEVASIFTGSYKFSGNKIEFHDETLGLTDSATLNEDILRFTVIGVGDFEGQTDVYVFHRAK